MHLPLAGKVSLVTGASRGIGAATAIKLASLGSDVVVNYRSKGPRAEQIVHQIEELGRRALAVQADMTVASAMDAMIASVQQTFQRLDVLILNASGGLEKGKSEDYAMALNHTAQLRAAEQASRIMAGGGRILFVTSHWAHFYGSKPVMPDYEVVAKSKRAGEEALRSYSAELSGMGVSLVVVSGDMIDGTITPRLLERKNPGMMEQRRSDATSLPTIDDFAEAIVRAAWDPEMPTGHTVFVGSTDY
jgi:NAD(P)-dependent dehydrogenase (short-subunit alcohol dehydrogenase family)